MYITYYNPIIHCSITYVILNHILLKNSLYLLIIQINLIANKLTNDKAIIIYKNKNNNYYIM